MASDDRQTTPDLIARLAADPTRFDFFRAVRLLEAMEASGPRLGESLTPSQDFIRLRQRPSLAFARSTLDRFQEGGAHQPHQLWVNFLGLFGPNAPLPLHITEYAHDRETNAHDGTMTAFLNIFHHRMLSLFYRAWARNQKAVDLDRPQQARFATYIGSLFGLGTPALRDRDVVPDWAKLFYSGRLVSQTRNAEGLQAILRDFLAMPLRILPFLGHWLRLPEHSVCLLGEQPETGTLGSSAVIGSRVWDSQLKFRIHIGPIGFEELQRLLPGRESFARLKAWVLNYDGQEHLWDVQVVLRKEEVPQIRLGQSGSLGWTSWLCSQPLGHDPDDLVLDPAIY